MYRSRKRYLSMDGVYIRGVSLMIKLLFLEVSSSLYYSNSLSIISLLIFSISSYGGFLTLYSLFQAISIVHLFIIQPCTQLSVLLSIFSGFLWTVVLKILFRGLLHINAVRKAAAVHLMRWWQLFPKIFMYLYHLCTRVKSIFIVGVSWKIVQVTRMPARLMFVRFEKDDPLGPRPSTLSWRDHPFWDLPSHLLILRCIPISKWGLRPNIRIRVFAFTITYEFKLYLV